MTTLKYKTWGEVLQNNQKNALAYYIIEEKVLYDRPRIVYAKSNSI
jgi:hypothetical protein